MMFIRRQFTPHLLIGIIAPLLGFIILAGVIFTNDSRLIWDVTVLEKIHATQRNELDEIAIALTQLARGRSIMAIAIFISMVLAWRKQWQSVGYLLVTVVGSGLLNLLAKVFFHRHRPDLWESPLPEFDFSFPSGHAMLSMTLVIALTVLVPQNSWRSLLLFCGVILAIAVGWTRLYLGVHYPSDILGGWALAIAWTTLIYAIFRD
jgi:membrane-associated phospholipid phosphatase